MLQKGFKDIQELKDFLEQQNEYTKFLIKVQNWSEVISKPPHNNPYDRGEVYRKFFEDHKKWTGLLFSLPPLTPRRVLIRDKETAGIVKKLKSDMEGLKFTVYRLVAGDKTFLFDPLVKMVILFNIQDATFLKELADAIKRKPTAKPHARKKSELIYLTAFFLSRNPGLRPSQIEKRLQPALLLLEEAEEWQPDSFRKWFKRNQKEILEISNALKGPAVPA